MAVDYKKISELDELSKDQIGNPSLIVSQGDTFSNQLSSYQLKFDTFVEKVIDSVLTETSQGSVQSLNECIANGNRLMLESIGNEVRSKIQQLSNTIGGLVLPDDFDGNIDDNLIYNAIQNYFNGDRTISGNISVINPITYIGTQELTGKHLTTCEWVNQKIGDIASTSDITYKAPIIYGDTIAGVSNKPIFQNIYLSLDDNNGTTKNRLKSLGKECYIYNNSFSASNGIEAELDSEGHVLLDDNDVPRYTNDNNFIIETGTPQRIIKKIFLLKAKGQPQFILYKVNRDCQLFLTADDPFFVSIGQCYTCNENPETSYLNSMQSITGEYGGRGGCSFFMKKNSEICVWFNINKITVNSLRTRFHNGQKINLYEHKKTSSFVQAIQFMEIPLG